VANCTVQDDAERLALQHS